MEVATRNVLEETSLLFLNCILFYRYLKLATSVFDPFQENCNQLPAAFL